MDSGRRSPSPRSHRKSQYNSGRRNEYAKGREQDSGWAGRRRHEEQSQDERPRERDEHRSHESRHGSKHGRSGRDDDYDSRREERRDKGKGRDRSRSRSPPRKRRRSRSRSQSESGSKGRTQGYGDSRHGSERLRDEGRYDRARKDGKEDNKALVRREEGAVSRNRSRSGSSVDSETRKAEEKKKPNYGNSGLLAAATNTVQRADGSAAVLKYNEPPEARKPVEHWRLYEFKDTENTAMLAIHRQSVYLFGRDAAVVDIPLDHPSCSKQHAALQYRHVVEKNEFGEKKGIVKPFIIDLESTNGTHVNDETIPTARYYELKLNDVIKFGTSSREFVLLHESAVE